MFLAGATAGLCNYRFKCELFQIHSPAAVALFLVKADPILAAAVYRHNMKDGRKLLITNDSSPPEQHQWTEWISFADEVQMRVHQMAKIRKWRSEPVVTI
jgi:hypothetical protein